VNISQPKLRSEKFDDDDDDNSNNNADCTQFDETVEHKISVCMILAKEQYIET